jgi:hypothetical protein
MIGAMKSKVAELTLLKLLVAEGTASLRKPVRPRGMFVRLQSDVDPLGIRIPEATDSYDIEIEHLCSLCESWTRH